ncbi:unnamed protein product [Pieris macdunnoughi]|uniref:Uncharacterized protein n=1 Tax=Pieris macdunnoughi TaxID=345717 RepID=A0A821MKR4_9NEOP|nr:unnamed protein product [Pieris macdunnoughi]
MDYGCEHTKEKKGTLDKWQLVTVPIRWRGPRNRCQIWQQRGSTAESARGVKRWDTGFTIGLREDRSMFHRCYAIRHFYPRAYSSTESTRDSQLRQAKGLLVRRHSGRPS